MRTKPRRNIAPQTADIQRIKTPKRQLQKVFKPLAKITQIPTSEKVLKLLLEQQFGIRFQILRERTRVQRFLEYKYGAGTRDDPMWTEIYKAEAMRQLYDVDLATAEQNINHLEQYCLQRDNLSSEQVIVNIQK
jgi:hypothetical protein